ncbi:hypothetical protein SKAU_G00134520 [Synaphobranchus kaupii]|uniref:Uncharacterized protein n=1 Tax=Synaphobranchus kaupii TaxID=118154 RepID=A0A9Q1FRM2_SYNKA|nr:hypothetical protein SKAU_G00134520 [Synaphobranchus kaupii]
MENDWWIKKASKIQHHADTNNSHAFYDAIKSIYGPQRKNITPVRSADGATLYKDKQQILDRWVEHFNTLLNTSHPTQTDILSDLPCLPRQPFGLPPQFLRVEFLVADRHIWSSTCHQGITHLQEHATERRRHRGTNVPQGPPLSCAVYPYTSCGKLCGSRIGLHSHMAMHR